MPMFTALLRLVVAEGPQPRAGAGAIDACAAGSTELSGGT
eukprot:CAMPEP_0119543874 /NCGR_PEP_ID=MMETSP1344-20130328/54397_1 /TAXON_ID=236787 /ORGANISM="Florenciella parvula, Strain CCMP2471" /LENGTH=39 /DNA_ID= /DNA_START= /DNA_END= /DNA_ORIENTATION=